MATFNRSITYQQQLTLDTDAYTANDVLHGLITIDTGYSHSGTIRRIRITDDDDVKAALTVYVFDELPTSFADDAPFAPVIADLGKNIDEVIIAAGDYTTLNGNARAIKKDLSIDYDTDASGKTSGVFYIYVVCTGTPTYTASALKLYVTVWVDGAI